MFYLVKGGTTFYLVKMEMIFSKVRKILISLKMILSLEDLEPIGLFSVLLMVGLSI